MIYQPRNVQPSSNSIDADIDNTFTMEMQTNSYISAYQLSIIDFNNNPVYTGTKEILSEYLYNEDTLSIPVNTNFGLSNGVNYKWRTRLYQPLADMLITYGLTQSESTTTNIYLQKNINIRDTMKLTIGSETKTISSYDIGTGLAIVSEGFSSAPAIGTQYYIYSDFIETVPDYIFYARQTPSLYIENVPNILTRKYYLFKGVYVQNNGVPIVYHIFNIYILNKDGSKSLVNTSGKIYSANLSYQYNNFRTGNTYYIEMIVENDMGIISQTNLYSFDVSYQIIEYLQQPQALFDSKQNAIKISWSAPIEHDATSSVTGDNTGFRYLYDTPYSPVNSLYTKGYTATWHSEDGLCTLPVDYNITFQFSPDGDFFYDDNGRYREEVVIFDTETDEEGAFQVVINKNKLIFRQDPSLSLESYFYDNVVQVFVLTETGTKQTNEDYIWDDTATWNDNYIWTEGGTSLERICEHWWKVQITKTGIKIEEVFPG